LIQDHRADLERRYPKLGIDGDFLVTYAFVANSLRG
jgi:hypothetical protein